VAQKTACAIARHIPEQRDVSNRNQANANVSLHLLKLRGPDSALEGIATCSKRKKMPPTRGGIRQVPTPRFLLTPNY
jgi:hypothetical protein